MLDHLTRVLIDSSDGWHRFCASFIRAKAAHVQVVRLISISKYPHRVLQQGADKLDISKLCEQLRAMMGFGRPVLGDERKSSLTCSALNVCLPRWRLRWG